MTRRNASEIMEFTTDQFREMLQEYATYDTGMLKLEAQRQLDALDLCENIHQMRRVANRWTVIYDTHNSDYSSDIGRTIILNLPPKDRLDAALKALKGTMPSIIALYNQLYSVMRKYNDPGLPELIQFGETLELQHPGIGYFLDAFDNSIEEAGDVQAQLDLVVDLLLRQPGYKAAHIFHIVGPQGDYGVAVHHEGYSVAYGDTEIEVVSHPKMNIHSALEVGGLIN